ncbi:hypothetical protein [Yersinia aleksiciae]|uniref:Uncharacterized protein n=1 Tax=Yersinia aleksiciae TaxID=263819 RepID=A0A0T9V0J2_YERAE|nr:hypothetical protein [Yersinia aleksiciae]CNL92105.1 Uncharacterised protein [Yersinia aleksiciae]
MMDMTKSREESRKQFEYEAGKTLCLPTSIIELARKGDGYDHAFDSMNIMNPLNGWWHWWKAGRESIEVELPKPEFYMAGGSQYMEKGDVIKVCRTTGIRIKGESE